MKALKWNHKKHCYEPYETPKEWNCPICADDFAEEINCAACGKELPYGESYTSMEIHTEYGFGYSVCADCHAEELERKRNYEEQFA